MSELSDRLIEAALETVIECDGPLDDRELRVWTDTMRDALRAALSVLADAIEAQTREPFAIQRFVRAADVRLIREAAP